MIAAIYARRSKEQDDAEDEAKSVNRQVENARVFATAKGWTVLEEHIYIDDGISGGSSLAKLEDKAAARYHPGLEDAPVRDADLSGS